MTRVTEANGTLVNYGCGRDRKLASEFLLCLSTLDGDP